MSIGTRRVSSRRGYHRMAKTEAQIRATQKYDKKAYYRPTIYLSREYEMALHDKAAAKGKTVSTYIQDLIKADLGIIESEENE